MWVFSSCLFDKTKEVVDLDLTQVPAGVDRIRVAAVTHDAARTELAVLADQSWKSGQALHLSLGAAEGKDWDIEAEGFQGEYLVYRTFIPSGRHAEDSVRHTDVTPGWPGISFDSLTRDSASVRIVTSFRNAPSGTAWRLSPSSGAFSIAGLDFMAMGRGDSVFTASDLPSGGKLIAELFKDGARLPVQVPDTLLAAEALAPAHARVHIADAYREGDSVLFKLTYQNFQAGQVDNAVPGQGYPMLHDVMGWRLLSRFHIVGDDIAQMVGPAADLDGVTEVVIALHYSDGMRIRPAAAESLGAATALRPKTLVPTMRIASHTVSGDTLRLILQTTNFQGLHCHIYRDVLQWPPQSATLYQTCHSDTCEVGSRIWQGATKIIVAVHKDDNHDLVVPVVKDSVVASFTP